MATSITESGSTSSVAASPAARRDWLRIVCIILTLIGLCDAIYLSYAHLTSTETACPQNGQFNCEAVQSSKWSVFPPNTDTRQGSPVAYLGLIGYILILGAELLESRIPAARLVILGLVLFGFLFSAYLTSTEAIQMSGTYCMWCLLSAAILTALLIVSFVRVYKGIYAVPLDEEEEDTE